MEEFSFVQSNVLDFPVNVRMLVLVKIFVRSPLIHGQSGSLEGQYDPPSRSTLLQRPDLRHIGSNIRYAPEMS